MYLPIDNAYSTLASSLGDLITDVTVTVQTGHGARFAVGSDYTYATLEAASGSMEIIKITAQSGDTLTVVRGQGGTTRLTWNIGDIIEVRPNAAAMTDIKADAVTAANTATQINAAVAKSIPVDADKFGIADSAASFVLKSIDWASIKTALKTYFDALYAKIGAITGSGLTMSTGKLLRRSTATTGAVEEITVSTGLSLSGGNLTCTVTAPVSSVVDQTGAVTIAQIMTALQAVDGPDSGLDADTLDGYHATGLPYAGVNNNFTFTNVWNGALSSGETLNIASNYGYGLYVVRYNDGGGEYVSSPLIVSSLSADPYYRTTLKKPFVSTGLTTAIGEYMSPASLYKIGKAA